MKRGRVAVSRGVGRKWGQAETAVGEGDRTAASAEAVAGVVSGMGAIREGQAGIANSTTAAVCSSLASFGDGYCSSRVRVGMGSPHLGGIPPLLSLPLMLGKVGLG
ncbi:unnamed protein product, partial [Discosporangium mesarthrocarpum]